MTTILRRRIVFFLVWAVVLCLVPQWSYGQRCPCHGGVRPPAPSSGDKTPAKVVTTGGYLPPNSSELWYVVNNSAILYDAIEFERATLSYEELRLRNKKLKDPDHAKKIKQQIHEWSLLLAYEGDFSDVIRRMAKVRLQSYTAQEINLLVQSLEKSYEGKSSYSVVIKERLERLGGILALGARRTIAGAKLLRSVLKKSQHHDELAFASEALLAIEGQKAVAEVVKQLDNQQLSTHSKCYIMLCLSKYLDDTLVKRLKAITEDTKQNFTLRRCAMISVARRGTEQDFKWLQEILGDSKKWNIHLDAARLVGLNSQKEQSVKLLVELLRHKRPELRREAAFALAQIGDSSIKEVLAEILMRKRSPERDHRALEGMVYAYASLVKNKKDLKVIDKYFAKNANSSITFFASVGLARANYQDGFKLMDDSYKKNGQVTSKIGLLIGMSFLKNKDSAAMIDKVLKDKRFPDLQHYAAFGASYIKDKQNIDRLMKASESRNDMVRHAAVAALGLFGEAAEDKKEYLKKISEEDKISTVKIGAAFAFDILNLQDMSSSQTMKVLLQLGQNQFSSRRVDSWAILEKVNEFYPIYHKTFLGF